MATPPLTITIAAVDRTQVIPFKLSANDQTSQIRIDITAPGIATMHCVIWDQTNSVTVGDLDSIVVTDPTTPGHNAFNGYVSKRELTVVANYRTWTLDCFDLNSWIDLKVVGAPTGTTFLQDPPGVYTAYDPKAVSQASDATTVQWLFAQYAPDLPVDTFTFVQTIEPTLSSSVLRWNATTLRQSLDELAALCSSTIRYWIDPDWAFHWTTNVPLATIQALPRLFPYSPGLPPAPANLTDGTPSPPTTFNYEDLKVAYDDTGWSDSIWVEGATGYTYDPKTKLYGVGGTGWAGGIGPTGRQRILVENNSDTKALRDSIGLTALANSNHAIVRGSCVVPCNIGGWFPGQAVSLTSTTLGIPNVSFMLQRVTTDMLSGVGDRLVTLEFGDAPRGTIGLRRLAQGGGTTVGGTGSNKPRHAASRVFITVSNAHPGPSGVVRVYAQVVDESGNAWRTSNAGSALWSVAIYNTAGTDVTSSTTGWSLSATSTSTNLYGLAWVDLTTSPTADRTYYVSAEVTL